MDGGAGPVWRITDPFRLSGTAQGYLTGFCASMPLPNQGIFCGIRHICRITTPWYQTGLGALLRRQPTRPARPISASPISG